MIEQQEMDARIVRTVAEVLVVPEEQIGPASRLADLGADSLDVLDIYFHLEKQFDVEITPPINPSLAVVDIANFLREHS
jgi:acyl carrier protein